MSILLNNDTKVLLEYDLTHLPSNVWCCIISKLDKSDWFNVALACKSCNRGLHQYMRINFGHVNTFKSTIPECIHKWKCRNVNIFHEAALYPDAFENPNTTIINYNNNVEYDKELVNVNLIDLNYVVNIWNTNFHPFESKTLFDNDDESYYSENENETT